MSSTLASLALRNLGRRKRRSALMTGAMAFCFGISLAIGALANGTSATAMEIWAGFDGGHLHVYLEHQEEDVTVRMIEDDGAIFSALRELGIGGANILKRTDLRGTLLFRGEKQRVAVAGVERNETARLSRSLTFLRGDFEAVFSVPNGIALSDKSARALKLDIDDEIQISGSTLRGQRNVDDAVIKAIYETETSYDNAVAYVPKAWADRFSGLRPGQSTSIKVWLDSADLAPGLASELAKKLETRYTAKTDTQVYLFTNTIMRNDLVADDTVKQAYRGERFYLDTIQHRAGIIVSAANFIRYGGLIILLLILAVTVLGLNNNFRMLILERIKEIGTLRSLGMKKKEVASLFFWEGAILLGLGLVAGTLFGFLLMAAFSLFTFDVPDYTAIMFSENKVHFRLDLLYFALTGLLIAVSVLASLVLPSRKAAGVEPAQALRETH